MLQDSISPVMASIADWMSALVVPGAKLLPTTQYGPAAPLMLNSLGAPILPLRSLVKLGALRPTETFFRKPRPLKASSASLLSTAWILVLVMGDEEAARCPG